MPRLKGIAKLDMDALLTRILTKSDHRIVIIVDQVERLLPYTPGIVAGAVWKLLMATPSWPQFADNIDGYPHFILGERDKIGS